MSVLDSETFFFQFLFYTVFSFSGVTIHSSSSSSWFLFIILGFFSILMEYAIETNDLVTPRGKSSTLLDLCCLLDVNQ